MISLTPIRTAIITSSLFLVAALFLLLAYHLWGMSVVADVYYERSFSFLNRLIQGRQSYPLEQYYAKVQELLYEAIAVLLILSLVPYLVAFHRKRVFAEWGLHSQIQRKEMFIRRLDIAVFAIGLFFSMTMVFWLDDTYHKGDVSTFVEWQSSLNHALSDVYIECSSCNYPILGTFFSAGVFNILRSLPFTLESETYTQLFRYVLSIVDGANVLLAYLILRTLSIRRSLFWAGLIGLLPSSWIGGALWGQIDGFTQFFLLAFLLYNITFLTNHDKANPTVHSKRSLLPYVIGSSAILACLLLTKQLAIFSVPVLVCMVFATLYLCSRRDFLLLSSTFIALVAIGVLLPDIFLNLKEGYFSHLQYILFGGGSSHGDKISGNGFNIWMFLGRNMWSSSKEPFFSFLTPRDVGTFLFLSYELFLFGSTFRWFRNNLVSQQPAVSYQEIFLTLVFLLALTNLSFNVILTGTHERYLYHFYPFVLIAYLGLRRTSVVFSRSMLAVILIGSIFYGSFVWRILAGPDSYLFRITTIHVVQAAFHLGLLCFLTTVFVRYQRFTITWPSRVAK